MCSIGNKPNRKETFRKTLIKIGRSNQKRRRIKWRIRLEGESCRSKILEGGVFDGMVLVTDYPKKN